MNSDNRIHVGHKNSDLFNSATMAETLISRSTAMLHEIREASTALKFVRSDMRELINAVNVFRESSRSVRTKDGTSPTDRLHERSTDKRPPNAMQRDVGAKTTETGQTFWDQELDLLQKFLLPATLRYTATSLALVSTVFICFLDLLSYETNCCSKHQFILNLFPATLLLGAGFTPVSSTSSILMSGLLRFLLLALELLRISPEEGVNHDVPGGTSLEGSAQVKDLSGQEPVHEGDGLLSSVVARDGNIDVIER